jgi:hypothetical protein
MKKMQVDPLINKVINSGCGTFFPDYDETRFLSATVIDLSGIFVLIFSNI